MKIGANLREDGVPVGVHDLNLELMIRLRLRAVVCQLENERYAERSGELLSPQDRDATTEDEGFALRDLGGVAEEGIVQLHGVAVYERPGTRTS